MTYSKLFNYIHWKKRMNQIVKKIPSLNLEKAGISSDCTPFIKLNTGAIFYGSPTSKKYLKFYNSLPIETQRELPKECFGLGIDIIVRYFEGGLKSGGPKKEEFYSIKKGDVVVEMGAFMGHYSIYLSEKVSKSGKIVAIEPLIENLTLLKRNIKANKLDNVVVIPKGVWKEKQLMRFHIKKQDKQSLSIHLNYIDDENVDIEADSLDNLLKITNIKHVNFMIIQLNGAEIEALEGLTNIKPENLAIAARYKRNGKPSVKIIEQILKNRGYRVDIIDNEFVYARLNN